MSKHGSSRSDEQPRAKRRRFPKEFKEEAVQMLLDGHSAPSVAERLGLSGPNLLYRWKRELIGQAGTTATTLESRVRELEQELKRVERERDVLKKSLGHFRPRRVRDIYTAVDHLVLAEEFRCRKCVAFSKSVVPDSPAGEVIRHPVETVRTRSCCQSSGRSSGSTDDVTVPGGSRRNCNVETSPSASHGSPDS